MKRLSRGLIPCMNSLRQIQVAKSNPHPRNQRSFLLPAIPNIFLSFCRYYSTELQPQLSTDLLKIMEQRLAAIEHRSAFLENFMNQTARSLTYRVFEG